MTDIDAAVNVLGGNCNKVIYDDLGMPSIMVEVAEQVFTFDGKEYGTEIAHPAFLVNGVRKEKFYVSKYQNVIINGRAYSLPVQVPEFKTCFDTAFTACACKGLGWHLMTNAEWAYLAIQGYLPNGNNNNGCDYKGDERGGIKIELADRSLSDRILTGSGPVSYSHNGSISGIWDLNGNSKEWIGGLRLVNGEIQIIKDNDAADFTNSQSFDSEHWKALLSTGEYVAPGTAYSLKTDFLTDPALGAAGVTVTNKLLYPTAEYTAKNGFKNLTVREGITIPHIMKLLALFPWDEIDASAFSMKNVGERLALRGGDVSDGIDAGIRALSLDTERGFYNYGFRSSFVDILDTVILADEDGIALATENKIIIH